LKVKGCESIYALGDATASKWAPTAQVASSQGAYLSTLFNNLGNVKNISLVTKKIGPFVYSHLGALAYIGKDVAIADLPGNVNLV
jgi:NADH:ubiquinone reductase (non-electrogenic)